MTWFVNDKLRRLNTATMFRLRSGYYPSSKFTHIMKNVELPKGETCNKIDEHRHHLSECTKNEGQRQLFMIS